jgi:hypothetical protein
LQDATARSAPARPALLPHPLPRAAWVAAGALLITGAVLRLYGAAGDLWLDEIWSVKLAGLLRQGQFLVESLALDNNHYLNTLYLMLVGADAPSLVQRLLAILIGIATIPVALSAMRRSGLAAMVAATAMLSCGYVFVNYGSEARGYAGVILASLLAIPLVERALEAPTQRTTTALAIVAVIGFLFHPIMVVTLAMLGLWVLWQSWRSTADIKRAVRNTWQIFMPTAASLLPLLILIGGAAFRAGEYLLAVKTPFTLATFLEGYAGLYRALLGIPDAVPDLPILIVPILALIVLQRTGPSHRQSLGVIALILIPLAVLVARPPNVQYPRYYLASAIVFVLILAELFAVAWRSGAAWRALAVLLALGIAGGNAVALSKLFEYDRGDPLPALRRIAEARQPVLLDIRDKVVAEYLAPRHGLQVTAVELAELCTAHPGFILTSDRGLPETMTISQPGCSVAFRRDMQTSFWGLSGSAWTLYRAE